MNIETNSYNASIMVRAGGRPQEKEAPPFGQRLAEARRNKGLTQRELAELLSTTQKMVDYYERRAVNPALEVVQSCAKALNVPVSALVGDEQPSSTRAKPGPQSQLEQRFEQIKKLPRKKQQFIIELLDAMLSAEKA
jgi:transcriptional regulator with XRE-family HTH domain